MQYYDHAIEWMKAHSPDETRPLLDRCIHEPMHVVNELRAKYDLGLGVAFWLPRLIRARHLRGDHEVLAQLAAVSEKVRHAHNLMLDRLNLVVQALQVDRPQTWEDVKALVDALDLLEEVQDTIVSRTNYPKGGNDVQTG